MIIERRVFQAKPGAAAAVVAKLKEFQPLLERSGGPPTRVYTDHYSGRTDRVAWEFDYESLAAQEAFEQALMEQPEALRDYETWFSGLTPLIEGATVELWKRED
jgi:hypothetical protein